MVRFTPTVINNVGHLILWLENHKEQELPQDVSEFFAEVSQLGFIPFYFLYPVQVKPDVYSYLSIRTELEQFPERSRDIRLAPFSYGKKVRKIFLIEIPNVEADYSRLTQLAESHPNLQSQVHAFDRDLNLTGIYFPDDAVDQDKNL